MKNNRPYPIELESFIKALTVAAQAANAVMSTQLKPRDVYLSNRRRELVRLRQTLAYLCVKVMNMRGTAVAGLMSKDHATINHSWNAMYDLIQTDGRWRQAIEWARKELLMEGPAPLKMPKDNLSNRPLWFGHPTVDKDVLDRLFDAVISATNKAFGMDHTREDVLVANRSARCRSLIRNIVALVLRRHLHITHKATGAAIGRDNTTVTWGCNSARRYIQGHRDVFGIYQAACNSVGVPDDQRIKFPLNKTTPPFIRKANERTPVIQPNIMARRRRLGILSPPETYVVKEFHWTPEQLAAKAAIRAERHEDSSYFRKGSDRGELMLLKSTSKETRHQRR